MNADWEAARRRSAAFQAAAVSPVKRPANCPGAMDCTNLLRAGCPRSGKFAQAGQAFMDVPTAEPEPNGVRPSRTQGRLNAISVDLIGSASQEEVAAAGDGRNSGKSVPSAHA